MKKINKKYIILSLTVLIIAIPVSIILYNKFFTPLDCGDNSYVVVDDTVGEYCVFANQISIRFNTEVTYSEAVEIVKAIEGASVDDYYKRRDQDLRRRYYVVKIPAQTQQEQEVIVNKLHKLNSNIKSIAPVSHSFYEGPWPN